MVVSSAETIEVLSGRLYWSCVRILPTDTAEAHYFSTDDTLLYEPYYGDFGPLNISAVTKYCRLLASKMADTRLERKRIVHCCRAQHDTRANSVLLLCCWNMIHNNMSPEQAFAPFTQLKPALCPYRDASLGAPCYDLTVLHCLRGLAKARQMGWYDVETFDTDAYDYYERVDNGDFNWIVPGKFLSFSGPTQTPIAYVDGITTNTPETYFDYFAKNTVTGVVRFNNKVYDRRKFLDAGGSDLPAAASRQRTSARLAVLPRRVPPLRLVLRRWRQPDGPDREALPRDCRERGGRTRHPLQGWPWPNGHSDCALLDEAL